ncbi:hypothetical protein Sjap_008682 [Stephania japonica]|uniref:Uncharacterized protein n=1 Tax=Stephania japonica TaxID=461633 RepID=A0AAP0JPZ6_9MAGN
MRLHQLRTIGVNQRKQLKFLYMSRTLALHKMKRDEAEKEIDVISERPEEPQKESKEDQPLVLVKPPTLPCIFVRPYKGVVVKECSHIFYMADIFVSDDHTLTDSYMLEVSDELLNLKEIMYAELPKAIDTPFVVDISKERASLHSLILVLNLEDKVWDKFGVFQV